MGVGVGVRPFTLLEGAGTTTGTTGAAGVTVAGFGVTTGAGAGVGVGAAGTTGFFTTGAFVITFGEVVTTTLLGVFG